MTTFRIGDTDVVPGTLLTELLAASPDLAAFLNGCGARKRTTADFDIEGRAVHVDDWSCGGNWVLIHLDLAKDTFLDFTLDETGQNDVSLVYSGRDADRAYAFDDAGQDGSTLAEALGADVALPSFLAQHADLRIIEGDYTPMDGDVHQTSLTLAEPGSGTVLGMGDGGPVKAMDPVAAQQAAFAAAMAARGR